MRFQTLSLTALGLAMLSGSSLVAAEPLMLRDQLHHAKRNGVSYPVISPEYLSPFASDDAVEPDYVLVHDIDLGNHALNVKRAAACNKYITAKGGDTCEKIAKSNKITTQDFLGFNDQINHQCTNVMIGKKYCVKVGNGTLKNKVVTKKHTQHPAKHPSKTKTKAVSVNVNSRKKLQTSSAFTYYWTARAEDYADNSKFVTIKSCSGKAIANVRQTYADALVMEGAGVVGDKLVNLGDCNCVNYKCFEELNKHMNPFGLTSYGSPLRPYTTIAANDIPKGTKIFLPDLVGWSLPGSSKKHNGCLLVDDQSWSFASHHIDFYVFQRSHYEQMIQQHGTSHLDIYEDGDCNVLNYV
ncbi:hypothetical protein BDF14DRAFT_1848800 [Spinellus fusiger]|nr:hypothetical protein BDF14DRAFT_1848800 [Spinellus fusiger]